MKEKKLHIYLYCKKIGKQNNKEYFKKIILIHPKKS